MKKADAAPDGPSAIANVPVLLPAVAGNQRQGPGVMRILFTSTRGTGHLNPLLPHARALQARGHEVRVASTQGASAFLGEARLHHTVLGSPAAADVETVMDRARGLDPEAITMNFTRGIFAGLNPAAAMPKLLQAIEDWKPALVVRESAEFAGAIAAEASGLPHVRVAVHCGQIEERILSGVADIVDGHRRAAGLAGDDGEALRRAPAFTAFPAVLDGLPAAALERAPFRARDREPKDRESHTSGPGRRPGWFLDGWDTTDVRPLVYVTFGTEAGTSAKTQAAYRTALAALADLPVRAVLTTGPNMQRADLGAIPDNVAVERFVPQADVFPWCSAVLHHGGSGTLLGAAAAGLPMVVTPLFADQPANGRNVEAAGCGIAVTDGNPVTLADALRRVLADPAIAEAARAVREEMARMATVEEAAGAMLACAKG